ncbi:MAG: 30S ribosomal protein S20 [Andreesenia angusta]|nr:30S ribosomal protein S20 [Andreesenia angusta]
MANIKSAKKRIKVIETKTGFNKSKKSAIKTYITKFEAALDDNKIDEAKELLKTIEKKLAQAGAKNTIHKKAASRKISRLTKKLNNAI